MHRLQIPHCVVHIVNTIVQTTNTTLYKRCFAIDTISICYYTYVYVFIYLYIYRINYLDREDANFGWRQLVSSTYFLLIYKQQRPHIKFKLKAIDDAYLSRFDFYL